MEVNEPTCENWYYFIKKDGNETSLKNLQEQIDSVSWELIEGLSLFVVEMEPCVSEQTAKEMTKIDMNPTSFHRKFDGKLKSINFNFVPGDDNEEKIIKINKKLNYGRIERYIDNEDIEDEFKTRNQLQDTSSSEESEDEKINPSHLNLPSAILKTNNAV
jgi:hypothetical protein